MKEFEDKLYLEAIDEMINEEKEKITSFESKLVKEKKQLIKMTIEKSFNESFGDDEEFVKNDIQKRNKILELEQTMKKIYHKIEFLEGLI
jgi:putative lipase involved disintegration of autophagic bodies